MLSTPHPPVKSAQHIFEAQFLKRNLPSIIKSNFKCKKNGGKNNLKKFDATTNKCYNYTLKLSIDQSNTIIQT